MIGRRLGRHTVTARLGRGGMGTVYLAVDETGAPAALKVLAESLSSDPAILKRFELEQQIVGGLDHPRIVQGRSGLECADGQYYFVMDFVPGANLARVLRALHRLSAAETVHVGLQVCDALAFAHARGIVHRDLKPSNLLIDPQGNVRVTDFGLARVAECTRVTLSGQVLGTPEYMSPEQADGCAADGRSDLYATGVVLYEMVTGEPPFRAENPLAVLRRHCNEAPVRPSASVSDLPPRLEAAILRCLEKDPLRRFESATDLAAELRAAVCDGPPNPGARLAEIVRTNSAEETRPYLASTATPSTTRPRISAGARGPRSAALAWMTGAAILAATLGGIYAVSRGQTAIPANGPGAPSPAPARPATLRLLDGRELEGRVRAIDTRNLTFEMQDGRTQVFPLDQVEACTYR